MSIMFTLLESLILLLPKGVTNLLLLFFYTRLILLERHIYNCLRHQDVILGGPHAKLTAKVIYYYCSHYLF